MGEVYRARDSRLGREVAIKTLPAHLSRGGEHLARFRREARVASALNHPHICTIYDLSEHGEVPFIVMEPLKGETLGDRARAEDPLSTIQQHGYLWSAVISGNTDLVQRDAPRVLRSAPEFALVRWDLAVSLVHDDRRDEARAVLDAAPIEKVPTIAGRICLAMKLALEGKQTECLTCIGDDLLKCAWNVEYWSWLIAECYAVAGALEQALEWLENAPRRGFVHYPYLSRSRTLGALHANPRFHDLLSRVKITWEEMQRLS